MIRIILTSLTALSLFGCGNNSEKKSGIETVDFNRVSVKHFSQAETMGFLTSNAQTPLYFTEDMYLKNIEIIKAHDRKYYVADGFIRSASLIVFGSDGMPISKIGSRGQGPGEYMNISDFDIDKNGFVHLIDGNTDYLLIYNSDYKFTESKKLPFDVDLIKCLDDGNYLLALSSWNVGEYENDMLVIVDKDLNVLESILKYDKSVVDNNFRLSKSGFVESFGKIFFKQANIDDHVYVLNRSGHIDLIYHFDFGSTKVPYEYRTNLEPHFDTKTLHNYRALRNFAIVNEQYALGTIWDKGITKSFLLTRGDRTMYEKPISLPDDTSEWFLNVLNDRLVTVIANTEDILGKMGEKEAWSFYTLCFYTLK